MPRAKAKCFFCDGEIAQTAMTCQWCGAPDPQRTGSPYGRTFTGVKVVPKMLLCADCTLPTYLDMTDFNDWQEEHPGDDMTCPFCQGPLTDPGSDGRPLPFVLHGLGAAR